MCPLYRGKITGFPLRSKPSANAGVMNSLKPKICRGRHDTIMQQLTRTELRVEYFERTSHFDLPDEIELALENDYIINRDIYTDTVLEMIQMTYFLHEMVTPEEMLEHVHRTSRNS